MNQESSRRDFMRLGAGLLVAGGVAGITAQETEATPFAVAQDKDKDAAKTVKPYVRPTPSEVLSDMVEGNARFVRGEARQPRRTPKDFSAVAEGQRPRACVITCADSRVTPEILFDQGIGDIFVVRIAGNAISGSGAIVKGTIEYAVAELNVSLVMVLGHSGCGAIKAAIQYVDSEEILPGSINELVDALKPAVTLARQKPGDLLENSIRANVMRGVNRLRNLDPMVARGSKVGDIKVVGAVYTLKTGQVSIIG